MLKNVGTVGFQILGQTGVPPVTYPNLDGMARWAGLTRTDFAQAHTICHIYHLSEIYLNDPV